MNLQIQYTVVNLHGSKRLETLKTLEGNPEIAEHEPVRRAVNYIAYYGDEEAKQLALEIASKMKVISPEEVESLKA